MKHNIRIAVLGSTGYVGLELINILTNHPSVDITFLGSDFNSGKTINSFDKRITKKIYLSLI